MTKNIIFILIVSFCTNIYAQKASLSPYVRNIVNDMKVTPKLHRNTPERNKGGVLTAFVRTSDEDILHEHNCRIMAQWDDIYIAEIPLGTLTDLANNPYIERIEAGESCQTLLDTTTSITQTKELWHTPYRFDGKLHTGLTGDGVIVGVMDICFDLTHPTFWSQDMKKYRIKRLWDQLDYSEAGEPVIGKTESGELDTLVGRQYVTEEALMSKKHSTDGLIGEHGTHTSAIAAGSGSEGIASTKNKYCGMAPEADICLVANMVGSNKYLIPDKERYRYTTATDILGFKYIFDYADSVGKPCVISFSEGAHEDLYESGIYNEVLSKLVGPGRIICTAAGNEGLKGSYIHKPEGMETAGAFVGSSYSYALYVLRSKYPVKLKLTFYQETGNTEWEYNAAELAEYTDSVMKDTIMVGNFKYSVMLDTYPTCYNKDLYATDFYIETPMGIPFLHNALPRISITLEDAENDIEAFNAGGYFYGNELNPNLCDFSNDHNILFPSTADDVICVGMTSYVNEFINSKGEKMTFEQGYDGVKATMSSVGPSMNGNIKPDVMAPGNLIVSAYNSYYGEHKPTAYEADYVNREFEYNNRIYAWKSSSGTSMSCPVVAGIIAQWLQLCPSLTPDDVRDVIAHTSTHYDETISYPNNMYGWGQIDALAGAEYIQNNYTALISPSEEIENKSAFCGMYSLDGRKVISGSHGVYISVDGNGAKKVLR